MVARRRQLVSRSVRATLASVAVMLAAPAVHADEAPAGPSVDLESDLRPKAPEAEAPLAEAPPPRPYTKTLVLDSTLGAIGFLGAFGKVAPPAPWMHVQLGYELLRWLMVYGEGELAFTDTSARQRAPYTRAFPMYGFGGGARVSLRFTDRVGAYAQAGVGLMKADVPANALGLLGFRDAESLDVYLGARLGVEWFQIDRHFALGLTSGIRTAQGFARNAGSDSPLALDGGASLRYAF